MNYYNDVDPRACLWMQALIDDGTIAPGLVDFRSVTHVRPAEVAGYRRAHFFAGIAGWEYALQLARWPQDRSVWSGSCPCQPFSNSNPNRKGTDDERHLWPAFRDLIAACRPPTVVGEQVASKDGRNWLAGVCADLEDLGYIVLAADLCAAGSSTEAAGWVCRPDEAPRWERIALGAPHIRQRLFWYAVRVADAERLRHDQGQCGDRCRQEGPRGEPRQEPDRCGAPADGVGDAESHGQHRTAGAREHGSTQACRDRRTPSGTGSVGGAGRLSLADDQGPPLRQQAQLPGAIQLDQGRATQQYDRSPWSDHAVVPCRDGKARRLEPGLEPLAHGVPGRVALLKGFGNAIVAQTAATFIEACLEAEKEVMG